MEQIIKSKTSTFSSLSFDLIRKNKTKIHSYANKAIVLMFFVLTIVYIASINDLSIKGFVLQDLKKSINSLEAENERDEIVAMNLTSYELLNEKAVKRGMVKVDDIKYVTIVGGAVAKK